MPDPAATSPAAAGEQPAAAPTAAAPLHPAAVRHRRHRRVGYALAVVAVYLGFCHLPDGRAVITPSGRSIEFLSLTRNLEIRNTRRSQHLLLRYYTLTPGDTAEARDVLAIAFDAARQTGDSVIVVEQINGRQRWRWLGIRIAHFYRYRKTPAGDWRFGV